MCKISDKLLLCTCEVPQHELPNYWVFYKYHKDRNEGIVGEAMLPYWLNLELDKLNKDLLVNLLNEGNVFDVELNPQNKDRLLLHFTSLETEDVIEYGFRFQDGKWIYREYDFFEWYFRHDEEQYGEIKNPIDEKNTLAIPALIIGMSDGNRIQFNIKK